ncbi:MAG: hypothetical protein A2284_16790 [Deltaproteobacteria bacterium RIFOXYA12_FULL_61_11]|nr:MAG: hypothetical protein A2284_16790 [Deltaproteobacteria bacterium RIFOXYA12_FULL_61_11]
MKRCLVVLLLALFNIPGYAGTLDDPEQNCEALAIKINELQQTIDHRRQGLQELQQLQAELCFQSHAMLPDCFELHQTIAAIHVGIMHLEEDLRIARSRYASSCQE